MGIFANASIMMKYFEDRGEKQRDQVITTIFIASLLMQARLIQEDLML